MKKIVFSIIILLIAGSCRTARVNKVETCITDSIEVHKSNLAQFLMLNRIVELESVTIALTEPTDSQRPRALVRAARMSIHSTAAEVKLASVADSSHHSEEHNQSARINPEPISPWQNYKKTIITFLLIGLILLTLYRDAKRR